MPVSRASNEALDERERPFGHLAPTAVDGERVTAVGELSISVTAWFCRWRLNDAFAIAHGTVWSFSPSMISSGPRSGFLGSSLASVRGFRLALAICIRATPGVATW